MSNKLEYKLSRPSAPIPFLLDLMLDRPKYRELTKRQIAARVLLPVKAGCVRFLTLDGQHLCAFTFNRLTERGTHMLLGNGPNPGTWLRTPGGILWVIDAVAPAEVNAHRFLPTVTQSLIDQGIATAGEHILWYYDNPERFGTMVARDRTEPPKLVMEA